MTSDKGKVARQQQVGRQAGVVCSCYAAEMVSTGQNRPGLVTIKENRCLTMGHSHVYSLRAERDFMTLNRNEFCDYKRFTETIQND